MTNYDFKSVVRETMKAWYLEMNGGNKEWFPKNVCRIKTMKSGRKVVYVPQWLVDKKITETVEANQCPEHWCQYSTCGCEKK